MISLYLPLCQGGQLSSHVGRQVRLHSGREEPNSATRRKPLAPRVAIGTLPPPQGAVGKYPAFLECGMGRDPDGPDRVLMDMGEVGAHVTSSENIYIYRVGS